MKSTALALAILLLSAAAPAQPCPCDCNGDRTVRVHELTTAVGISLARLAMESCPAADADGSASVGVNDLVAGVGAALGGCPTSEPTPTRTPGVTAEQIAAARALWRSQGLFHYQYRYDLGCFCRPPRDVLIEVFDDRMGQLRDPATGEPVTPDFLDLFFTIDGLFDHIEANLDVADVIEVQFDPILGYPTFVFIDYYRGAVDDELSIDVSDVEPLQMAGVCRTANDCDVSFEICIPPGGFAGCGACMNHEPECERDADCGGDICEPIGYDATTCACDPSVPVCKPACNSDADCDPGEACGEDRHCAPRICRQHECSGRLCGDDCPDLFTCDARIPSPGHCRRTACASDSDCGERIGFCVNGECHGSPGRCDVVPP